MEEVKLKLDSVKQNLLELNFKKKAAEEKETVLKKELGGSTVEQLEAKKADLTKELLDLDNQVDKISVSLKTIG